MQRVRLLDEDSLCFVGIAKMAVPDRAPMTAPAQLMGTPGYMAPEQARGENDRIGPASDQFALAATLYEMLTGQGAFFQPGDAIYSILERVVFSRPAPLPDPQINLAVQKALSKSPEDRYPTIGGFLAAVGATSHTVYSTGGNPILPSSLTGHAGERALARAALRRNVLKVGAVALGISVLLAAGSLLHRLPNRTGKTVVVTAIQTPIQTSVPQPVALSQQPKVVIQPELEKLGPPSSSVEGTETEQNGKPSGAESASKPSTSTPPRFVISGFASKNPAMRATIHTCAKAHLGHLALVSGTVIRLERSGTLTVVSAPQSVFDSGLNGCLRQQLNAVPVQALPQTVHITVSR